MSERLLTEVLAKEVNDKAKKQEYGVALINMPDFNYEDFCSLIRCDKNVELFFLGFGEKQEELLKDSLRNHGKFTYSYSVEEAEESRNSGNEDVFRILILKKAELEKTSSLKWFPQITMENVYKRACSIVKSELSNTNNVITALITALGNKSVRRLMSFEHVIDYLEILWFTNPEDLTKNVGKYYYMLGLCADKNIMNGNPNKDEFVKRIKANHAIVDRISNLDQSERQSITNYYTKATSDKTIPRLILDYYYSHDIELLSKLDISDVEECLKAAKEKPSKKKGTKSTPQNVKPTTLAAKLVFDDEEKQIDDIIKKLENEVDNRPNTKKAEKISLDVNDTKLTIKTEPSTETIAEQLSTEEDYGGLIYADVNSPEEAIRDLEKYSYEPFQQEHLKNVWRDLDRIADAIEDADKIKNALTDFIASRNRIVPFKQRLQDVPMLQVLAKFEAFNEYLQNYEKLLAIVNDEFPRIWALAASNAKEIVNTIVSLDYVFVMGEKNVHAIPTPLHPLYLWKYIELAKEILSSRGVNELEESHLTEDDKSFIIRKAEDIPDPLSVVLLPSNVTNSMASFLPLAGRLGLLPIYSNVPQVNQSESGIDALEQAVVRYICLYPHAGMMLKMSVIDPPSVEVIISMLKALDNDKEFNIDGIEINIFRTKEVPSDWVEISEDSLNDGMLGKYRGNRSLNFKLKITNQKCNYSKILSEMLNKQHLTVIFDPNEVRIETTQNNKQIHINPLCIPKIYKYNPLEQEIEIRPASEGGIFTVYSSILEKLNERPSTFSHTATCFNTPLREDTYKSFLEKTDWLIILDQSLKSWDISLKAASEKLFYKENDYRSIGIYSNNCQKFILGYDVLAKQIGNFIPKSDGIKNVIESIRSINDDGLLSIVSHSSNRIFDSNHGKGSLGLAIAAIHFKNKYPNAMLVGLDTQLAKEWLSDREDGKLPDIISLQFDSEDSVLVDVIEVKTYSNSPESFQISDDIISGHAVEQATVLDVLLSEMFGKDEKITTVSRREILREQVFEALFNSTLSPNEKLQLSKQLNSLFAGECTTAITKNIAFVDFDNPDSSEKLYYGNEDNEGNEYLLSVIGSDEIQTILANNMLSSNYSANNEEEYETKAVASTEDSEIDQKLDNTNMPKAKKEESTLIDSDTSSGISTGIDDIASVNDEPCEETKEKCARLNKVLRDYNIQAYPVDPYLVQNAARFTRFQVELKSGETIRNLIRTKDDIGIQLEAAGEILIDHIRGTKYVAVDVPFNKSNPPINVIDYLHLLDGVDGNLNIIAGQLADGTFNIMDISTAPHMLVAGTTGSGKTIFLQSILVSLLHQFGPDELSVLIVDPKQTDFVFYEGISHLYGGHVVTDADEALEMIQRIDTKDKEERTALLKNNTCRDIESYNKKFPNNKMKRIVVVIDEYSDLIQAAEVQGNRKDFENTLLKLLQRVRNLGIHIIIATQRPSAQIITGALKSVIPYRASFRLPSHTDSQTILDSTGAEDLLGKGDMLMRTDTDTARMQGLYISESDLESFLEGKKG